MDSLWRCSREYTGVGRGIYITIPKCYPPEWDEEVFERIMEQNENSRMIIDCNGQIGGTEE